MYLFFDTETTGLPKDWRAPVSKLDNWPRVVQLGWMLFDAERKLLSEANLIVRPEGFKIPADAARLHGITQARALVEGVALSEAVTRFRKDATAARLVVAHNLDYDDKVLSAELLRLGETPLFSGKRKFCTKEGTTQFCAIPGNYGYKWPTLAELHGKLFGHGFEGAHDALADVRATARCFFELQARGVV